jgi:hypothetical protein
VSYEFTIDDAAGILTVTHSGTVRMDEVLASRAEGIPIVRDHGIRNVMIDLREAQIALSVAETFEFQAGEPQEYPLGTRLALVLSAQSWAEEDVQFAVNVATNRGLIERAFTDLAEAVAWITRSRA